MTRDYFQSNAYRNAVDPGSIVATKNVPRTSGDTAARPGLTFPAVRTYRHHLSNIHGRMLKHLSFVVQQLVSCFMYFPLM